MIWFKGWLELFQVYRCIQWGTSPQAKVQRAARIGPSAHSSCTEWEIWWATHWERWGWSWNRISLCSSTNERENITEALFHTIPLGICYSSLWTLGLLCACRKVNDKIKKMAFVGFSLKENCLRLLFSWRNSSVVFSLYQTLLLSLLVKWCYCRESMMMLQRNMKKSGIRLNLLKSRNCFENKGKAVHCILLQINVKCTLGDGRNKQDHRQIKKTLSRKPIMQI